MSKKEKNVICKNCEFNYKGICHHRKNVKFIIEGRREIEQVYEVKADKEVCKYVR